MNPTFKIKITGIVQGVGFRPHVYRCARSFEIKGYVFNNDEGVIVHAQSEHEDLLNKFIRAVRDNSPPLSMIDTVSIEKINAEQYNDFNIVTSEGSGQRGHVIPPDAFICDKCYQELFDPNDRRYLYPFINCMHCGPRYTIVKDIPYDRSKTTMSEFEMCQECRAEYEDPLDRRFHAQPIACPNCGPKLTLYDKSIDAITSNNQILSIVKLLKEGNILAVKGVGGYHLMVDPYNTQALKKLRERKKRDEKPFCLIFESVKVCEQYCELSDFEKNLLTSPERPIVLVPKSKTDDLSELVAPNNANYGVMLAYTPLHYLILKDNFPCLVCTSANVTDRPIIYKDDIETLLQVADYVVTNDRKIHTFTDDSIIRSIKVLNKDEQQIIRRSRGYVPKRLLCPVTNIELLCVGAELKSTVCMVKNGSITVSQYIGDLKNLETYDSFKQVIEHIKSLYKIEPQRVVCDLHPDFISTNYAKTLGIPLILVQHHHAHMSACMVENNIDPQTNVIGIVFDGMGYGNDGNIWGGEFLVGNYKEFSRAAYFDYFSLPGGDISRKKINIVAFACLLKAYGNIEDVRKNWKSSLTVDEMFLYQKMINNKINSPLTSSVGRIFDVVSSLINLCQYSSYEGQAAILLEQSMQDTHCDLNASYPFLISFHEGQYLISLDETFVSILNDFNNKISTAKISWRFHNTMIKIIHDVCHFIRETSGLNCVVLSGGCFQNKFLLVSTIQILSEKGFKVCFQKHYPPNDSCIALGQAAHVLYSV